MRRSCSRPARRVEIPYDPGVVATSIGRGVPFTLAQPQSQVAMSVTALADILAPPVAGHRPAEPAPPAPEPTARRRRRLLTR